MKIPSSLRLFYRPTVVVVTDSRRAKCFFAMEDQFAKEEKVVVDDAFEKGGEGHARTAPGVTGAPAYDTDRMHWEGKLRHDLFTRLGKLLSEKSKKKKTEEFILCVPAPARNELMACLSASVKKQVRAVIPKNFYRLRKDKLLAALKRELEGGKI